MKIIKRIREPLKTGLFESKVAILKNRMGLRLRFQLPSSLRSYDATGRREEEEPILHELLEIPIRF